MKRKTMSVLLALLMLNTVAVTQVGATEVTGTGDSSVPVTLTAEAATFSVTVPSSLIISVNGDGVVTTADNAKIVNNGYGAVIVNNIDIEGQAGWVTVDYDSTNMQSERVGTKKIAFEINGEKTTGADAISFSQSNFPAIDGKNDTDTDELSITYSAKLPAQANEIKDEEIVNVTFTISWFE